MRSLSRFPLAVTSENLASRHPKLAFWGSVEDAAPRLRSEPNHEAQNQLLGGDLTIICASPNRSVRRTAPPTMSDSSFVFDPRRMISPPFRNCPECGLQELGVASVSKHYVLRRCRACLSNQSERLPALRKTLVYLDQMALSNVAKSLDPVWAATRQPQDPFWVELFDLLDRLLKLQLVVCPESSTHEQESGALPPYWPVLRRLYEHLASDVSLEFPLQVYGIQLHHALEAYLAGTAPNFAAIDRRRVLSTDPDHWADRLQIRVNFGMLDGAVERYRSDRDGSGDAFAKIHARWAAESDRRFDDWYQEERGAMVEVLLDLYISHLRLVHAVTIGAAPFTEDVWNPRLEVDMVGGLLRRLEQAGVAPEERFGRLREFLASEAALSAPSNDISALLMAALARKAAAGQRKPPNRGAWNDIKTIAAYLPYVDAMFVDDQFAGLMREEPLKSRLSVYPTRVFSNRTREAFAEYLRGIEAAAPPEHRQLVKEVYGDSWLIPYRTILAHERDREARGGGVPPGPTT